MLRTNTNFLSYIEQLYGEQTGEDIVLKRYAKGDFIFEQNQVNRRVVIIKEGFVKCFFSEENGKDFIVEFLGRGEIIGEIEAIRNNRCLCNVEVLSDEVQVYTFSTVFFKLMLSKSMKFNQLIIEELAGRIINTSSRASSQQLYSIRHGLSKLLLLQKKQNISISKVDMAAYLGIDIRSLNRVLRIIKDSP